MPRSIATFDFTSESLDGLATLFPEAIDRDPWVLYHATSSVNEDAIDREGLHWRPSVCSRADVELVVAIFEAMNWGGKHGGGFGVLKSFSLQGDFAGESTKPIYFREYSLRTLLYAERDFAGGESARAIRYAVEDLQTYLRDAEVREQHYEYQRRSFISEVREGYLPAKPVIRVDLEWVAEQSRRLEPLYRRCGELVQNHTHGVVYAVKFQPEDLGHLKHCSSMGVRFFRPVSVDAIMAKARILSADFKSPLGNDSDLVFANFWREEDPAGLLATLKSHGGYTYHHPSASVEVQTDFNLGPAGEDESRSLALEYGAPNIVQYFQQSATTTRKRAGR